MILCLTQNAGLITKCATKISITIDQEEGADADAVALQTRDIILLPARTDELLNILQYINDNAVCVVKY